MRPACQLEYLLCIPLLVQSNLQQPRNVWQPTNRSSQPISRPTALHACIQCMPRASPIAKVGHLPILGARPHTSTHKKRHNKVINFILAIN